MKEQNQCKIERLYFHLQYLFLSNWLINNYKCVVFTYTFRWNLIKELHYEASSIVNIKDEQKSIRTITDSITYMNIIVSVQKSSDHFTFSKTDGKKSCVLHYQPHFSLMYGCCSSLHVLCKLFKLRSNKWMIE